MNQTKIISSAEEFAEKIKNEVLEYSKSISFKPEDAYFVEDNDFREFNFIVNQPTDLNIIFEGKLIGEAFRLSLFLDDIKLCEFFSLIYSDAEFYKFQKTVFVGQGSHCLKMVVSGALPMSSKDVVFRIVGKGLSYQEKPQMFCGEGEYPFVLKKDGSYQICDNNLSNESFQIIDFEKMPTEVKTFCVGQRLFLLFKTDGSWFFVEYDGNLVSCQNSVCLCFAEDCVVTPVEAGLWYAFFTDRGNVYGCTVEWADSAYIVSLSTQVVLGGQCGKIKKIWAKYNFQSDNFCFAGFGFRKTLVCLLEKDGAALNPSALQFLPTACTVSVYFEGLTAIVGDIDKGLLCRYALDLSQSSETVFSKIAYCNQGEGILTQNEKYLIYEDGNYKLYQP